MFFVLLVLITATSVQRSFNSNGFIKSCCSISEEELTKNIGKAYECKGETPGTILHTERCKLCPDGTCYAYSQEDRKHYCFCPERFLDGDRIKRECSISHEISWPSSVGRQDSTASKECRWPNPLPTVVAQPSNGPKTGPPPTSTKSPKAPLGPERRPTTNDIVLKVVLPVIDSVIAAILGEFIRYL